MNKVRSPLNVFISSKCGGKYDELRKEIQSEIDKSPLMTAFIYERDGASSYSSGNFWSDELERSDLFVCIIDNADGISETVHSEVRLANNLGKKRLFFFCSETSKQETQLQKDLNGSKGEKYSTIECFEDIPGIIIESINKDLVRYYREKRYLVGDTSNLSAMDTENSVYAFSVSKFLNSRIISNQIMEIIGIHFEHKHEYTETEENLLYLFKSIIKTEVWASEKFDKLSVSISNHHSNLVQGLIKNRLQAMDYYFRGEFENCIRCLSEILQQAADDLNVPLWLANNIAIDLRNVINENDDINNRLRNNNAGQAYINQGKEAVYFPLLDRKEKLLMESLNKIYFESQNSNVHFNLQNMGIFDYLSDIFILSLTYGSITHLSAFLANFIRTLDILNKVYHDYDIHRELIRLLIIKGDNKELARYVSNRMESQVFAVEKDIYHVISSIDNITIAHKAFKSKLVLLTEFSDYMNDDIFEAEMMELHGEVIKWLRKPNAILSLETHIFKFLKKNAYRTNHKTFIPIIDIVFRNNLKRFYRNTFDLMRDLDYKEFNEDIQRKILSYFLNVINEESSNFNIYDNAGEAIIRFTRSSTIDVTQLESLLEKKFSRFYTEHYLLEHTHKQNGEKFIELLLKRIEHDNLTQGLDGCYSYGGYNDYATLKNIVEYDEVKLRPQLLKRMIQVCLDTIRIDRQDISKKIGAMKLIMLLYSTHQDKMEWYKDVVEVIKNVQVENFLDYHNDFMEIGNNIRLFKISKFLFLSLFDQQTSQKLVIELLEIDYKDNFEVTEALSIIRLFLKYNKNNPLGEEFLGSLAYFSSFLLKSDAIEVQKSSVYTLIKLSEFDSVNELSLNQISMFWDRASIEARLVIIRNIKDIKSSSIYKEYLLQKASLDNHYLIKKEALKQI